MRAVILGLTLFCASAVGQARTADKELRIYTAQGPWALNYADNVCRLSMELTDGRNSLTLAFERFGLEPYMRLGLAGGELRSRSATKQARLTYLPSGKERRGDLLRTQLADGRDAFFISNASFVPNEDLVDVADEEHRPAPLARMHAAEAEMAAKVNAIVVDEGFTDNIELRMGPMAKPHKAMQACAEDLVKSWGVDPDALALMTKPPEPVNSPGFWLNSSDYPAAALRAYQGGTVGIRLIVGPDGTIERCNIDIDKAGPLEEAACSGIVRRARFEPAIAADGKPMRAIWSTRVIFSPRSR